MPCLSADFSGARKIVAYILMTIVSVICTSFYAQSADQSEFLKEVRAFIKDKQLPPAKGAEEPRIIPQKGDDYLYHQDWFLDSFLNLKEDLEESQEQDKRFVVIFEQRGCGYCRALHNEILAKRYIHDYIKANFNIIQLDLWGKRKVTDFDGQELTEQKLAQKWGVLYTPSVLFFADKPDLSTLKSGKAHIISRIPGGLGPNTFFDMFTWVRIKGNETDLHFQRFHIERGIARDRLKKKQG